MSSSGLQSVLLDIFCNRPWAKEKRGEYLLGSLLDWKEQPGVNKALWKKPASSLQRSEA